MLFRSAVHLGILSASLSTVVLVAMGSSPTLPVPSTPLPAVAADTTLRGEVTALNVAMVAAFNRNPASVARFYADSARIVGPNRQTVSGRTAIDRYWAGIRKPATWKLDVIEVGGSADEAYQIGVSTLASTGSNGRLGTYVCDFVVIWKRQPDGTLRIALDLYN